MSVVLRGASTIGRSVLPAVTRTSGMLHAPKRHIATEAIMGAATLVSLSLIISASMIPSESAASRSLKAKQIPFKQEKIQAETQLLRVQHKIALMELEQLEKKGS